MEMESSEKINYQSFIRNSRIINGFNIDKLDSEIKRYPQTELNFSIAKEVLRMVCDTFNCNVDDASNQLIKAPNVAYARRTFAYAMQYILQLNQNITAYILHCSFNSVNGHLVKLRKMLKEIENDHQQEVFFRDFYPKYKLVIEEITKYVNK